MLSNKCHAIELYQQVGAKSLSSAYVSQAIWSTHNNLISFRANLLISDLHWSPMRVCLCPGKHMHKCACASPQTGESKLFLQHINNGYMAAVSKLSAMDHLISWADQPGPPVCYYKQARSCDRNGRLLQKLIEAAPSVLCWRTVGWLFGQAVWYSTLSEPATTKCPLQTKTLSKPNGPGQSAANWVVPFRCWGIPLVLWKM